MAGEGKESITKDFAVGVLALMVFVPFLFKVGGIYIDPSDPGFGSQDFPKLILYSGLVLGLSLIVKSLVRHFNGFSRITFAWRAFVASYMRPLTVIAAAFLYVWCIALFQYALPTFVLLVFLIWFFGNKGMVRTWIVPLVAVLIYFLVFFVLFGLYEEPGVVISYDSYSLVRVIRDMIGLH